MTEDKKPVVLVEDDDLLPHLARKRSGEVLDTDDRREDDPGPVTPVRTAPRACW